nr:MAG TPA: hypothetical protein [Caudoviricetes sp.]
MFLRLFISSGSIITSLANIILFKLPFKKIYRTNIRT